MTTCIHLGASAITRHSSRDYLLLGRVVAFFARAHLLRLSSHTRMRWATHSTEWDLLLLHPHGLLLVKDRVLQTSAESLCWVIFFGASLKLLFKQEA